jgi:hypothetical protein
MSTFFNKIEILAHIEVSLVKFGIPKNWPGHTLPTYQISAHLINHTQIYELLCIFLYVRKQFFGMSLE